MSNIKFNPIRPLVIIAIIVGGYYGYTKLSGDKTTTNTTPSSNIIPAKSTESTTKTTAPASTPDTVAKRVPSIPQKKMHTNTTVTHSDASKPTVSVTKNTSTTVKSTPAKAAPKVVPSKVEKPVVKTPVKKQIPVQSSSAKVQKPKPQEKKKQDKPAPEKKKNARENINLDNY
jgi:hypothetical protein